MKLLHRSIWRLETRDVTRAETAFPCCYANERRMMSMQFHAPPFVHLHTQAYASYYLSIPSVLCILHSFSTLVSICKLFIIFEGMKLSSVHDKVLLAGSKVPYLQFLLIFFFFCISKWLNYQQVWIVIKFLVSFEKHRLMFLEENGIKRHLMLSS